jgi:hypothetical protein
VARWLPALLSLVAVLALATPAEAKRRCTSTGKTVARLPATRVFAKNHAYYACQRGRTRFLWSGRHTPDEEISFAEPRAAGRWLAFVDYYCTLHDGFHIATIVRVDMRGRRSDRQPALTAPPQPHNRPRVTSLSLAPNGSVTWSAELGALVEQHTAPAL